MLSPLTKLYGVGGAVVVAGEACEASACVEPLGSRALAAAHVLYRTRLHALAAAYTSVCLYAERLVFDETMYEVCTYRTAEEPR